MPPADEIDQLARLLHRPQSAGKQGGVQKIGNILAELLARRGYAQGLNFEKYAEVWQQVAGPLAEGSRAGIQRGGVLEILVLNSAVVVELQFQKKQLLKKLGQLLPEAKIRDLKFRVDPAAAR